MGTLLLLTIITSSITALILFYFFKTKETPYFSNQQIQFDPNIEILESIKELEADFEMGKLSEEEFKNRTEDYKKSFISNVKK